MLIICNILKTRFYFTDFLGDTICIPVGFVTKWFLYVPTTFLLVIPFFYVNFCFVVLYLLSYFQERCGGSKYTVFIYQGDHPVLGYELKTN